MKICYFGAYDNFSRNRVFIEGLKQNNIKVVECKDSSRIWFRWIKLILKYFKAESNDIIVVCASNHINVPLAYFLSILTGNKLVFDAFVSLYDTYVYDRKIVNEKSIKAKYYYYLDKISCYLSDLIILDTIEHAKYFSGQFNIPSGKIKVIYVGSDDKTFNPLKIKFRTNLNNNNSFLVHFHGSFIPLQGIQYIVKAAKILEDENIIFRIIGRGQTYNEIMELIRELKVNNIIFKDWVNYSELPNYINESDICLGIFGDTKKAKRVIPNKVYEYIAMSKPIITGNSPAINEVFINKKDIFLCEMANPEDLANSIMYLRDNKRLREKIAKNGYISFKNNFTPEKIGQQIRDILN